ncbi:MAG: hypothetical protein RBT80_00760 [Candidatus Vecturithrix sp.]|jgi:hypothetical protein|nr:hypothetical protein [Candidatus Vecturithrix sp.]
MTAVDEVGNESQPSNSAYHNVGLLPVATLRIVQEDDNDPVVSWSHSSPQSLRYDLYLGADDALEQMNQESLTLQSYTDTGYTGDERRYTVVAVDANLQRSSGRSLTLPILRADLAAGTRLKRGVMNTVNYAVTNLSHARVEPISLHVRAASRDHVSSRFSLDPGETQTVPVVIGGYGELPDLAALTSTLMVEPREGERVEIIRHAEVQVGEGMLVMQILNDAFTRGATGEVRFTLENTGDEEIEMVTASGSSASPGMTAFLTDADGNVLSATSFKQFSGSHPFLWTLTDGRTVARIPAGGIFESAPVALAVPGTAPDTVTLRLAIDWLYYHYGKPDQVKMKGLSGTRQVSLRETSYDGEILSISPEVSMGDQEIAITGRAVRRATGEPLADALLNLTIAVRGFERTSQVLTDNDGTFVSLFTPLESEYGVYTVRAVHPDLLDKPVHGTFRILRLGVSPTRYTVTLSRNVEKPLTFTITTGEGTVVNNLRLSYEAADQPGGTFPAGVAVTPGDPVELLGSASSVNLPVTISADDSAPDTVTLYLKVKSDEHDETGWRTVSIQAQFRAAEPELSVSPTYLETGLVYGDSDTKTLTLKNIGLAALEGVTISLTLADDVTAAPEWVKLTSPADIGDLAVGEQRAIDLMFTPTPEVEETLHEFHARISSSNADAVTVPIYVTVTTSETGNVQMKVMDLYTGTAQAGARVRLYYEANPYLQIPSQTTDDQGETLFSDLPAGRYTCRITSGNYNTSTVGFWVKAGLTTNTTVLLEYQLVTVEWEVKEITLEDRYEIVLKATYKTDVPAAVVAVSPLSVTLPEMNAGDVFHGEFTLTNQGLIRADHLAFHLPASDEYFRYELLTTAPERLAAKEQITLPYRVTCVQSLTAQGESDDGGGGNECLYLACGWTTYEYICAHDIPGASTQSGPCFLRNRCGAGATGMTFASPPALDGGDHNINLGGGSGGSGGKPGGGGSPSPNPAPVGDRECYPDSEKECDPCDPRASQQGQGTRP